MPVHLLSARWYCGLDWPACRGQRPRRRLRCLQSGRFLARTKKCTKAFDKFVWTSRSANSRSPKCGGWELILRKFATAKSSKTAKEPRALSPCSAETAC